ncbi:hypothetical protein F4780DRAFT_780226 [Xylariomycetidae sp. FL0641]|nr:hypothetical protein F4780DRAFT_780226 [Xylariomycetidae sp. FL0641]
MSSPTTTVITITVDSTTPIKVEVTSTGEAPSINFTVIRSTAENRRVATGTVEAGTSAEGIPASTSTTPDAEVGEIVSSPSITQYPSTSTSPFSYTALGPSPVASLVPDRPALQQVRFEDDPAPGPVPAVPHPVLRRVPSASGLFAFYDAPREDSSAQQPVQPSYFDPSPFLPSAVSSASSTPTSPIDLRSRPPTPYPPSPDPSTSGFSRTAPPTPSPPPPYQG